MTLYIFVRFHARENQEGALERALVEVVPPSRQESGCLEIQAYRSASDPRLFYIHSRWQDEADFDRHATLPHTVKFIQAVEPLLDHPLEVTRTSVIA